VDSDTLSLEPAPVGRFSSAFAVDIKARAWLQPQSWQELTMQIEMQDNPLFIPQLWPGQMVLRPVTETMG